MTAVLALLAACAIVALVTWLAARRPQITSNDLCEVCGAPATHELSGDPESVEGGFTAMVATYCRAHAPQGSVRVR